MNGIRIKGSKSFIMGTFFFVFFTSLIFSTSNAWAKSDLNLTEILDRLESLETTVADQDALISEYENP